VLLRRKISIIAAASVAIAVAIAVLASYFIVRGKVIGQVDSELTAQAQRIEQFGIGGIGPKTALPGNSANAGAYAPYVQYSNAEGGRRKIQGGLFLPVSSAVKAVAQGTRNAVIETVTVSDGSDLRMFAFHATLNFPNGSSIPIAIELARPLGPVESVLSSMRLILTLLFLAVVALAALLARMATRRVMRPLAEVTATAKLIGETDDLSRRLAVHEADEVGQLATRFNEMLERLEISRAQLDASVTAQRQLVADASHELRTPVTSLRTNIEVLLSGAELDDEDRTRLLTDVVEQSEELSNLVSDLIEVARGDTPPTNVEDIRLDRLAEDAIDRARRNAPHVDFREHLYPVTVHGNPERLMRAINNLLDNAALHAGHGGPIELTVDRSGVIVRDHGDGIAETDLPHVFDRFYRGANSRSRQGSGLGLAIVSQAAAQHRGSVTVANAADGGAIFTLALPSLDDDEPAGSGTPGPGSTTSRLWSEDHDGSAEDASSVVADDPGVTRDTEVSA
jgi:two-component system sensor histidine kinase MprB